MQEGSMKKAVVLGASGVVGQHMIKRKPSGIDAVFTRRVSDQLYEKFDAKKDSIAEFLDHHNPDVVINLVGQNNVDAVEKNHEEYICENVELPLLISRWTQKNSRHFIQVSTQGVFSGEDAPYFTYSKPDPITWYRKAEGISRINSTS
jgi:dTDP-4-dehydrorhamnose reductase